MAMPLNPDIFVWARETAGLSRDEAAQLLGFKDTRRRSAAERLAALESGEDSASRSVLRKMAKAYRRSLLVFYLDARPKTGDRGRDFRAVPGAQPPLYNPLLDALIRDIRGRQIMVKALLEEEDAEPLDFVRSANTAVPPSELAKQIPDRIGFSLREFRQQSSIEQAFTYLRQRLEASGIFVLLLGNLGSHHTNIPVEVFRGYAIADPIAPFIVVNDQDVKVAWSFTALHEAAHLWLGSTGVSSTSTDAQIERYCNDIASEILLPRAETQELAHLGAASLEEAVDAISRFAQPRNLGRSMVAYTLLRARVIDQAAWRDINARFTQDWLASRERHTEVSHKERGPSYYVVRRHRLGSALLNLVGRSLRGGILTHTKAGQALGVKPRNVEPLLHGTSARGGR
ncbi:MAG: XRE family transcriptional regulator [Acidobacteria bacterium]|nr:XRE family transcriptional regulator [Acidobacteriota bacterium]